MILLLFTTSYPYDYVAEYPFIQPELNYLLESFERIILVPRICKGVRHLLPARVEVDEEYAAFLDANSKSLNVVKKILHSKIFYGEIQGNKAILLHPVKLLKLLIFSGNAELTRQWVTGWLKKQPYAANSLILYSYWFNHVATGLGLVKQDFPGVKFISRAHGYDIYEEYYFPYYWPRRRETLDDLDMLFVASEAGRNYFCEHYPEYLSKFETAHLGIQDPAFVNRPSSDGVFRIASCAYIVPVKRLNLLLDGVATAARLRPEQKFEWIHFGDGASKKSLDRKIALEFPGNARARLLGNVPNPDVMRYYRDHPVDVFVNVSSTEGGAPVSIQEAISCGIPAIATSVGGNPEIVSEQNGILLNPDPSPEEIANAILAYIDDPQMAAAKRKGSRTIWMERYNADVNFRSFADRLKSIGEN